MSEQIVLSWRDILDSHKSKSLYNHIDNFLELVVLTGYQYFCWNGWIYEVIDNNTNYTMLDIKVEDIPLTKHRTYIR